MKLNFANKKKSAEGKKLDIFSSYRTRSFRVGGYSVVSAVIVLAIAVAANFFVNALPSSVTQFDTTSNQLFTISEQTEAVVGGLEEDVAIYWIVQSGYEDSTLEKLLDRYTGLSDHVKVEKKDPDVYPTFVQQYTSSVSNNSLIVASGERWRYVDNYDIYEYDYTNYYSTGSVDVSFAGESALTSAIDYAVSADLPKLYTLTGHGESTLASTFSNALTKENVEVEELTLLTLEAVPEDADGILIYAPQTDISQQEKEMLLTYLQSGGSMLLITDPPQEGKLTNLEAVMEYYGVAANDGIVVEGSQSHYAWGTPYYLLPDINSHAITSPLVSGGYRVLLPIAQGLTVSGELRETLTVTQLLTTSESAFSKLAGYGLNTYEKESGDIEGPFALAAAVTETIDEEKETNIVWVTSSALLNEQTNSEVSGGNQDFFLNCVNWMCGEDESSITIHAKTLGYEYLTMDSAAAAVLTILVVAVIPLTYLSIGIYTWIRRKRR